MINWKLKVTSPEPVPTPKPVPTPEPVPTPKPVPVPKPVPAPEKAEQTTTYTVEPGDMLWKIAKKFNTTLNKLVELNKLKNANLIFSGQKLIVPAN
jgi:5'-nucleotidase / UDP-sugar diphosphatase